MDVKLLAVGLLLVLAWSGSTVAQTGTSSDPMSANLGINAGEITQEGQTIYYTFDAEFGQFYTIELSTEDDFNMTVNVVAGRESKTTTSDPQNITYIFAGTQQDEMIVISTRGGTGQFQFELSENDDLFVPRIISFATSLKKGDFAEWGVSIFQTRTTNGGPEEVISESLYDIKIELLKDSPSIDLMSDGSTFPNDRYNYSKYFKVTRDSETITGIGDFDIEPFLFPTSSEDVDGDKHNLSDYFEFGPYCCYGKSQISGTSDELQISLGSLPSSHIGLYRDFVVNIDTGHLVSMNRSLVDSYTTEEGDVVTNVFNTQIELETNHLTSSDEGSSPENGIFDLPVIVPPILVVIIGLPLVRRKNSRFPR